MVEKQKVNFRKVFKKLKIINKIWYNYQKVNIPYFILREEINYEKKLAVSVISFAMVALSAPLCFAADGIDGDQIKAEHQADVVEEVTETENFTLSEGQSEINITREIKDDKVIVTANYYEGDEIHTIRCIDGELLIVDGKISYIDNSNAIMDMNLEEISLRNQISPSAAS